MEQFSLPPALNVKPYKKTGDAFIAPGAQLTGTITLGERVSIWHNAVVRADLNAVIIGDSSNLQDGSVVHVTNALPCRVGNFVTIGHNVNLHACVVEDYCLIGIGAIILTGAEIGAGSVVGAGAVVREGEAIAPGSLVVGVPARLVRRLGEREREENRLWAEKYVALSRRYQEQPAESD